MFLSVDPGANGAIVIWDKGKIADVIGLPNLGDPEVEAYPLTRMMIESVGNATGWRESTTTVVIEKVGGRPGNGVQRNWSFAYGLGRLEACIEHATNVEWVRVTPKRWQQDLGCLTGGDKNITKNLATELFPEWKVTHQIADAMLIGEWYNRFGATA